MKYTVTSSPHIRGKRNTQQIMLDVILALLPALIAGTIIFGMRALLVAVVCIVAAVVAEAGYDPYEKKVLGITAMTSLMGKKKFEEVVGSYIVKPQGKPALVPESDKRPAMNTAYDDFNEI